MFSFQASATFANSSIAELVRDCWIIPITTSCGNSYNTQYCNGGLHGATALDWAITVDGWDCGRN